jgi:hypothetical protein
VNHYQRLKVAHDAPAEVIRAAYRALATKLHPDRQGASTGPDDAMHTEMAALNAAYETLIDPKLRADYDATLAPGAAKASPWAPVHAEPSLGDDLVAGHSQAHSQADLDWLTPSRKPTEAPSWRPDRQMLIWGVSGAVVVAVVGGVGLWRTLHQRQMEEALSQQYHEQGGVSGVVGSDLPPPRPTELSNAKAAATGVARKPSVDELSRMSDEELIKVLPTLDTHNAEPAAPASRSARAAATRHMLDGPPLRLRVERELVDPLAPEPKR